ncbi:MAG: thioredoxin family protein [Steroidobacteraceae bacterium]|nr:thioredoxin family protein [Steroidobacteraceae bacterium]
MKIQILGSGCAKCRALAEVADQAARDMGLTYELEKITDVKRFADFGVMFTPALVVDGAVKVSGKVPSLDEAKEFLS